MNQRKRTEVVRAALRARSKETVGAMPKPIVGAQLYTVRAFCKESGPIYRATAGYGATQRNHYSHPKSRTGTVMAVGEQYHLVVGAPPHRYPVLNINSDHWKTWVHARLRAEVTQPGALTLYRSPGGETHHHLSFAKHLTSERKIEEFVAGRGIVTRWEQTSRNNHWLDALELASVGAHVKGIRLATPVARPAAARTAPVGQADNEGTTRGFRLPDGRPYLITERERRG